MGSSSPRDCIGLEQDNQDNQETGPGINDMAPSSPTASSDSSSTTNNLDISETPKTALDILRPQPWVPPSKNESKSEIAGVLEQLTMELIQIFRSQDWSNPLMECMVANFSTYIDFNETRIKSIDAHRAYHQWMHQLNPGYDFEVESISADVNEEKGTATVWALLRVTGHPQTIRRESMTLLCWRRSKGKWRCYKQIGIRGVSWFNV